MAEVTIYRNPRCATSRKTLELLRKRGIEPRIVEYLKTPPGEAELKRLLKLLGIAPRALLRKKEAKEAGLDSPASPTRRSSPAWRSTRSRSSARSWCGASAPHWAGRPRQCSRYLSDERAMIRGFSDHAANERTYLAWVRTGIAVIAFGFVIERFNLFLLAIASSASVEAAQRVRLERLSGPLGRYDGAALIVGGLALILAATFRFIRTGRQLDDAETHSAADCAPRSILSAALVVFVAIFSAYLVLG